MVSLEVAPSLSPSALSVGHRLLIKWLCRHFVVMFKFETNNFLLCWKNVKCCCWSFALWKMMHLYYFCPEVLPTCSVLFPNVFLLTGVGFYCILPVGCSCMLLGCRVTVVQCWLLIVGCHCRYLHCWFLVIECWLSIVSVNFRSVSIVGAQLGLLRKAYLMIAELLPNTGRNIKMRDRNTSCLETGSGLSRRIRA